MPFLACPERIAGRELIFYVDNIAVYYGWENGGIKNDFTASVVLSTLNLVAGYLGCRIHVRHIHRVSNEMADLVDDLSRRDKPTRKEFRDCIESVSGVYVSGNLLLTLSDSNSLQLYTEIMKIVCEKIVNLT